MEAISADFEIKDTLNQLGIKKVNEGTSIGFKNFSNGEILESYSPVDGQLIAKVKTTSKADYEQVMETATTGLLKLGERCQHLNEEKL